MGLPKWFKKDKTTKVADTSSTSTNASTNANTNTTSENILWGRGYSGTAELRHTNLFLKVMIFSLFGLICWQDYSWREHSDHLSEEQTIIFHDQGGLTTAKHASDFRTGPSEEEINAVGWNIVRWVVGAGSNDVDTAWREARRMMTSQMQADFDAVFGKRRDMLASLNVYRKIENASVRPMNEKDLPAGAHGNISRYDVVVSGRIDTYRSNSKDKLASGAFSYRVQLVPLENRSLENPSGLLVASLGQIEEGVKADADSNNLTNNAPNQANSGKDKAAGGGQ